VAAFVTFLNETFLGVALPRIMEDLKIPASTGQWLNTSYLLTMAIVIPLTGYFQQRFSARRIYLVAMSLFTAGTIIGGLSPSFLLLVLARVIQAAGGALIFPLLMTTIMTLVQEVHRGKVMGNISIAISVAPALGPPVSGLILSAFNWRWLFWLIVPIAVITSVFGFLRLGRSEPQAKPTIDGLSVILSGFAFGGLIYGLSGIGDQARGTALVSPYGPLAAGVVAMVWLIRRQLKLAPADKALLNMGVFRSRNFSVSVSLMVILNMALFGVGILTPIYTQQVLGISPLVTGLMLLPGGLLMGLLGPVTGNLYDKLGARKIIIPAAIVVSISCWYLTTFDQHTSVWQVLASNIILFGALGFMFPPLFTGSMASVEPELYPHASAVVGSFQQVAGAAGTALFVTTLTVVSIDGVKNGLANSAAYMDGIHWAFVAGAILSVAVIGLAALLTGKASSSQPHSSIQH
jgi:DHA2 family lincomycin resistance protein-like MFS transporter